MTRIRLPFFLVACCLVGASSPAQPLPPATPEAGGLTPRTATFYINVPPEINNGSTESTGVAIASNGNVLIGWEDDANSGLVDIEAVWTLFDRNGASLTAARQIGSRADPAAQPITTKFLNYFRADGSPTPGNAAWGPKIHANLFGPGVGMGATAFALGAEIPELANINLDDDPEDTAGDFPAVQLLTDAGEPVRVVTGVVDADAQPVGDIRIADWEYLANGNVVVVGESRQEADLVSRFGGDTPRRHAVYRVVDAQGNEVKGYSLVSSATDAQVEMWHGAAATRNGFGLRFAKGGRATVRLFDNSGNPTTSDLDIGQLTGQEATAGGGRGDGTGFDGNGNDAYLLVNSGPGPNGGTQPWIAVLNANGTVRFAKATLGERPDANSDRVDGAIDPAGRVVVVFDSSDVTQGRFRLAQARLFDASGEPMGASFFVSEKETDSNAVGESRRPRVAWRGDTIVIIWESTNSPDTSNNAVAARFFTTEPAGGSGEIRLGIAWQGGMVTVTWPGSGVLEQSASLGGSWTAVPNASSPYSVQPSAGQAYFRVRQ